MWKNNPLFTECIPHVLLKTFAIGKTSEGLPEQGRLGGRTKKTFLQIPQAVA